MPKKGKDDLFRLIKSLSKTEKAYFRKFSERHIIGDKNNYLRLFDAIDGQEVYDEKALLKKEKYIRQLPYAKNYLMGSVLRAMQVFYGEHTDEHGQRRVMDNLWFLNKKKLYDLASREIEKAKTVS